MKHIFALVICTSASRASSLICHHHRVMNPKWFSLSRYASNSAGEAEAQLIKISTPEDMEALGARMSIICEAGDCLFLSGDLGAGKTSLSRGFIRSKLGDPRLRVTSPSYLLSQIYEIDDDLEIHHMDLYRLSPDADLSVLNLPDVLYTDICLMEWPDRLGSLIPENRLDVDIRIANPTDDSRIVRFTPHGDRWKRMLESILECKA